MSSVINISSQPDTSCIRKFNKTEVLVKKSVTELKSLTTITSPTELESTLSTLKTAKEVEKAIETKRTELVKPLNDKVKQINTFAKSLTADLTAGIDNGKKLVLTYNEDEEKKAKELRKSVRVQQLLSLGMTLCPGSPLNDDTYSYGDLSIPVSIVATASEQSWEAIYHDKLKQIQDMKRREVDQLHSDLETASFFSTSEEVAGIEAQIQSLSETPVVETVTVSAPTFAPVKGATKRWTYEITDIALIPREFLMVDEKKLREAITAGTREILGIRIYQAEGLTIR